MGWICHSCRTENAFDVAVCQACRAGITRQYLGREKSRAAAEHRKFAAYLKRQNAPVSDYRKLRRALPRVNAAMMLLLLALTVWALAALPHGERILPLTYAHFTPEAVERFVRLLRMDGLVSDWASAPPWQRLAANASLRLPALPARAASLAGRGADGVLLLIGNALDLAGRGLSRPYGPILSSAVQSVRTAVFTLVPRAIELFAAIGDGVSFLLDRPRELIDQLLIRF